MKDSNIAIVVAVWFFLRYTGFEPKGNDNSSSSLIFDQHLFKMVKQRTKGGERLYSLIDRYLPITTYLGHSSLPADRITVELTVGENDPGLKQ